MKTRDTETRVSELRRQLHEHPDTTECILKIEDEFTVGDVVALEAYAERRGAALNIAETVALREQLAAALDAKEAACDELDAWNAEAARFASDGPNGERRAAADAKVERWRAAGKPT